MDGMPDLHTSRGGEERGLPSRKTVASEGRLQNSFGKHSSWFPFNQMNLIFTICPIPPGRVFMLVCARDSSSMLTRVSKGNSSSIEFMKVYAGVLDAP